MAGISLVGRPSDYTPELGREICRRVATGLPIWELTLAEDMPSRSAVFNWLHEGSFAPAGDLRDFVDMYARAKASAAEADDDFADRVARDGGRDIIVEDHDGLRVEKVDHEHIKRSKLIVEELRWRRARRAPLKFGDRIAHQQLDEHGKPAKLEITVSMREPTDASTK